MSSVKVKEFFRRKDIVISGKRYGIDALGAMAQGLFASLLIGTIIVTVGDLCVASGISILTAIGTFLIEWEHLQRLWLVRQWPLQ
jgi:hypothetical protein